MNKNLYCKILAIGIIVLCIGVGIQPVFAVDTKQSIVKKESVEDCGCEEIDSRHLVRFERQLNRWEVYSKVLLVLSKYNPELREIREELTIEISKLTEIFEEFKLISTLTDSPLCDWVLSICYYYWDRFEYYINLPIENYYELFLYFGLATIYFCFSKIFAIIYFQLGCPYPPPH